MKLYIKTFGCVQNTADSERVKAYFWDKGYTLAKDWKEADTIVINTCIIRESAENRAYGLINNIDEYNRKNSKNRKKIVVTGCLVGLHDKKKKMEQLKKKFPEVDEFMPIEQISFEIEPMRDKKMAAMIPISSGCNNYCSYCIVPYARGKEISRPMEEILEEIGESLKLGFKEIILIGQNVNSYGADLAGGDESVVSMGKKRFNSLFPNLLSQAAQSGAEKISFISSNPWDFSDELISVIAQNNNIDRLIHLPIQAADNEILKRMNRGYTIEEYWELLLKIRKEIPNVRVSTDIIIGFPGETEEIFEKEAEFYKKCNFDIAYLNKYSPRIGTVSAKLYKDEIPAAEKKRRWTVLNQIINEKTT